MAVPRGSRVPRLSHDVRDAVMFSLLMVGDAAIDSSQRAVHDALLKDAFFDFFLMLMFGVSTLRSGSDFGLIGTPVAELSNTPGKK